MLLCATAFGQSARNNNVQLPDGMGKDITQKICGTTCHGPDIVGGSGRTRDQWTAVVNSMVARGAKATEPELLQIVQYLSSHFAPGMVPAAAASTGLKPANAPERGAFGKGPGPLGGGPADSHIVDPQGAERGRTLYIAECITCHGVKARGGNPPLPPPQQGADLIRSMVLLHDRYGDTLGPFLKNGHPLQSGRSAGALSAKEIGDLSHFLHDRLYATLRTGSELKIQNILTGDPKAGAAYFNGAGKCVTCHSATGDFAGIGKRYDPPTIQSKVLFPRTVGFGRGGGPAPKTKPITVKVTDGSGSVVEGVLDKLDDFNVSLRDAQGDYRSFRITPQVKVVVSDPLQVHVDMLDQYTDKNIHDVVAYLESLK